jgi:hypothetical protein
MQAREASMPRRKSERYYHEGRSEALTRASNEAALDKHRRDLIENAAHWSTIYVQLLGDPPLHRSALARRGRLQ